MGLMISKQTFGSGSRVVEWGRGRLRKSKEIGAKRNTFGKIIFDVVVVVVAAVALDSLLALTREKHGKHISREVRIYLTHAKPRSLSEIPMGPPVMTCSLSSRIQEQNPHLLPGFQPK